MYDIEIFTPLWILASATDDKLSVLLLNSPSIGDATGCETEAFFPAGTVSYSITAKAIKNTHVTDITGATGTITLQAGKAYTITLAASPVSGQIIPLIEGTHSDYFD